MSYKQITLDGKISHAPGETETLQGKVKEKLVKELVLDRDHVPIGKKYSIVFSSAPESIATILNIIKDECPESVQDWIDKEVIGK